MGESSADPLSYFDNNVGGAVSLLQAMAAADVRQLCSAAARRFGTPKYLPYDEAHPTAAINLWATKHIEEILRTWRRRRSLAQRLRYFNRRGPRKWAIGDDPTIPTTSCPM